MPCLLLWYRQISYGLILGSFTHCFLHNKNQLMCVLCSVLCCVCVCIVLCNAAHYKCKIRTIMRRTWRGSNAQKCCCAMMCDLRLAPSVGRQGRPAVCEGGMHGHELNKSSHPRHCDGWLFAFENICVCALIPFGFSMSAPLSPLRR